MALVVTYSAGDTITDEINASVQAATNWLNSHVIFNSTINIQIGYKDLGGPDHTAQSSTTAYDYPYPIIQAVVNLHNQSLTALAQSHAPLTTPFAATNLTPDQQQSSGFATQAWLKNNGLALSDKLDGMVDFNTQYSFNWDQSPTYYPGKMSAFSTLIHEITEILGRQTGTDGVSLEPTAFALYRYTSPGQIATSKSYVGSYFSVDDGKTNLAPVGEQNNDLSDWGIGISNDSFGYSNLGEAGLISYIDLLAMAATGLTFVSPKLNGLSSAQKSYAGTAINIFKNTQIIDDNATLTPDLPIVLHVSLSEPLHGKLVSTQGNYSSGSGEWVFKGNLIEAQSALSSLSFIPSFFINSDTHTSFSITIDDGISVKSVIQGPNVVSSPKHIDYSWKNDLKAIGEGHQIDPTIHVENLYNGILNRQSDAQGASYWTNSISSDSKTINLNSEDSMLSAVVHSQEFTSAFQADDDYIANLYQIILGRNAEHSEVAYWISILKNNNRGDLADIFLSSPEFSDATQYDHKASLFAGLI